MAEIVTGNELTSGATVYLDRQGNWVEDQQSARLFEKDDAAARDEVIALSKKTQRIISIETEKVAVVDGRIVPERLRERIRAVGPTAPASPDGQNWDRQHLGEDGHVSI